MAIQYLPPVGNWLQRKNPCAEGPLKSDIWAQLAREINRRREFVGQDKTDFSWLHANPENNALVGQDDGTAFFLGRRNARDMIRQLLHEKTTSIEYCAAHGGAKFGTQYRWADADGTSYSGPTTVSHPFAFNLTESWQQSVYDIRTIIDHLCYISSVAEEIEWPPTTEGDHYVGVFSATSPFEGWWGTEGAVYDPDSPYSEYSDRLYVSAASGGWPPQPYTELRPLFPDKINPNISHDGSSGCPYLVDRIYPTWQYIFEYLADYTFRVLLNPLVWIDTPPGSFFMGQVGLETKYYATFAIFFHWNFCWATNRYFLIGNWWGDNDIPAQLKFVRYDQCQELVPASWAPDMLFRTFRGSYSDPTVSPSATTIPAGESVHNVILPGGDDFRIVIQPQLNSAEPDMVAWFNLRSGVRAWGDYLEAAPWHTQSGNLLFIRQFVTLEMKLPHESEWHK